MGLRNMFRAGGGSAAGAGTALVVKSDAIANYEAPGVRVGDEVSSNELWYLNMGKRPHILTLEVRMPGVAPYELEVRERVPARFCPGASLALPEGIELPVKRTGDGEADVEIDWKAHAANPDAKKETRRAAAKSHNDSIREGLERANPGQQAMLRESNAAQLPSLVQMVKDGKMKRKTFDQQLTTLVTLGQLDAELAEAAKADLDGSQA